MKKELSKAFMLLEVMLAFFIVTTSLLVISRNMLFYIERVHEVQKQVQATRVAYEAFWLSVYTSANQNTTTTSSGLILSQPDNAIGKWQYDGTKLKGLVYNDQTKEKAIYFTQN